MTLTSAIVRRVAAVLAAVVAVVAMLGSALSWWATSLVGDTDSYVATVGPLIDDPAVNAEVSDQLSTIVLDRLDLGSITARGIAALDKRRDLRPATERLLQAASPALASFVEDRVTAIIDKVVTSEEFAEAWREANRQAHGQVVAVLSGQDTDVLDVESDSVGINVAALVAAVKTRLINRGFTLADRIPEVNASFVLFQSADIEKGQFAFRVLHKLRFALPIIAVLATAAAIALARKRRATAAAVALAGLLGCWVVILLLASAGRTLPGRWGVLHPDAGRAVFDAFAAPLRADLAIWAAVSSIGLAAAAGLLFAGGAFKLRVGDAAWAALAVVAATWTILSGWNWPALLLVALAAAGAAALASRLAPGPTPAAAVTEPAVEPAPAQTRSTAEDD